jgi:hypothetical protein
MATLLHQALLGRPIWWRSSVSRRSIKKVVHAWLCLGHVHLTPTLQEVHALEITSYLVLGIGDNPILVFLGIVIRSDSVSKTTTVVLYNPMAINAISKTWKIFHLQGEQAIAEQIGVLLPLYPMLILSLSGAWATGLWCCQSARQWGWPTWTLSR